MALAAAVLAGAIGAAAPAAAYDVATMHPGCLQQRAWCERAASVSYGDQARFRNALSAVIALEWVRMVETAQKVARPEGFAVRSPSVEEITADLIQAWRIGSSCCDVMLKSPAVEAASRPVDYDGFCRSGAGAGAAEAASVARCVDAVRMTSPTR